MIDLSAGFSIKTDQARAESARVSRQFGLCDPFRKFRAVSLGDALGLTLALRLTLELSPHSTTGDPGRGYIVVHLPPLDRPMILIVRGLADRMA